MKDYDPNMKASERIKNRLPTLAEIRRYKKILQNVFEEKQRTGYTPDFNCDLFLGSSSIRRAGWGVFAGKNYRAGDEITITGSWPHWIVMHGEDQTYASSDNENSTCSSSSTTAKFPTFSFLLKPHAILHNAEWKEAPSSKSSSTTTTDGNYPKLVATKDISTAEEIFLTWDQHPHQTFQHLFEDTMPTHDHFEKADVIIQDARKVFKVNKGHNVQKRRLGGITEGLMMLRRGIFRYDALVATLLPRTADELLLYQTDTSTSEVHSLENQTIATLASTARCMTNVEWKKLQQMDDDHNLSKSNLNYVLSKNFVGKGDLIMPIPLLLQQPKLNGEEDKSLMNAMTYSLSCFNLKNVALCPLTNPVMITNNLDIANAKYEWSTNSDQHKNLLDSILNSEAVEQSSLPLQPLSMSWDLVALRDIGQNETVSQSLQFYYGCLTFLFLTNIPIVSFTISSFKNISRSFFSKTMRTYQTF
jgi:hypothetical protein